MAEPDFAKHPVEYFGYPYTNTGRVAQRDRERQHCPFLGDECKKPRKSEPQVKVGVCTVGYKSQFLQDFKPVVICPHRFDTDAVFSGIANHYFPPDATSFTRWAPEVSIGLGGSVDYVLAKFNRANPTVIEDFVCVEFQAAGTTGTPWQAVLDFRQNRRFTKRSYQYGINWANEFAKTMMQQVYKKGMIVASWNKRIVFVLQDVGMEYLKAGSYDITGLNDPAGAGDAIHFYTLRMQWDGRRRCWNLVPAGIVGSDLEGIRKILSGSEAGEYLTLDNFFANIHSRLDAV